MYIQHVYMHISRVNPDTCTTKATTLILLLNAYTYKPHSH